MKYIFVLLIIIGLIHDNAYSGYVTYEFSGGRLGDNLLSFMHTYWIAYKYKMPLLYRPFDYSDQLYMHRNEKFKFKKRHLRGYKKIRVSKNTIIDPTKRVIYVIPYFSEDKTEFAQNPQWIYFKVDWNDPEYKKSMQAEIKPVRKDVLNSLSLPKDCISLAVHMRRGDSIDGPLLSEAKNNIYSNEYYADFNFPLKFPPFSFYVDQIKKVSELVNHANIYVHIFSNDPELLILVKRLKKKFSGYKNIFFAARSSKNAHDMNVLEDFFALTQFDCLIRPQSNFSLVASKLANYKIEIFPSNYEIKNNRIYINEVKIINAINTSYSVKP